MDSFSTFVLYTQLRLHRVYVGIAQLHIVTGDNPAVSMAVGFKESLGSSEVPCRHCSTTQKNLHCCADSPPPRSVAKLLEVHANFMKEGPEGLKKLGINRVPPLLTELGITLLHVLLAIV